jgi:hypothetical protein
MWGKQQEEKGDCIKPNIPEDGPIRPKHVVRKTCGVTVP